VSVGVTPSKLAAGELSAHEPTIVTETGNGLPS
jgi:hypothetical protein